ncbi:MAG: hexitol phosphatase HxpB [Candidatus Yanofskybacteria bacterium]|nr:hexitol phosphatase HxpB [Candidatus Yanofskybacteria bacterium]
MRSKFIKGRANPIRAAIFDMDGLLIDSEPFWQDTEVAVFTQLGVPLTQEMTKETMGLRVDEVVEHWFSRYPWRGLTKEETVRKIVDRIVESVKTKGEAKEGAHAAIRLVAKQGIPVAIASSSWREIIKAVIERLGITEYISIAHSAEEEAYGKPHPAVYLTTAQKLGVLPSHCLTFEDSPNGVLSAKAARMKCVAVPDKAVRGDKQFCIADATLSSLKEFTQEVFERLQMV